MAMNIQVQDKYRANGDEKFARLPHMTNIWPWIDRANFDTPLAEYSSHRRMEKSYRNHVAQIVSYPHLSFIW